MNPDRIRLQRHLSVKGKKNQQTNRKPSATEKGADVTAKSTRLHRRLWRLPSVTPGEKGRCISLLEYKCSRICPYPSILTVNPHLSLFLSRTNGVPQELAQKGQKISFPSRPLTSVQETGCLPSSALPLFLCSSILISNNAVQTQPNRFWVCC